MKSLFYIVLLCFLPFSGYSEFCPHGKEMAFYSPAKNLQRMARITANSSRVEQGLVIESIPCDTQQGNSKIEIAENEAEEDKVEDDDSPLSKRYLQSRYTTAFIFFTQTFEYFVSHTPGVVPCYKSISDISSCQYLIYQVFRI